MVKFKYRNQKPVVQYAGITLLYLLYAFVGHLHSASTPSDLINAFIAFLNVLKLVFHVLKAFLDVFIFS